MPHEIVEVDDGSTDNTWTILQQLKDRIPALVPVQNKGPHGFGRAVIYGLDQTGGSTAKLSGMLPGRDPKHHAHCAPYRRPW